MKVRMLATLAVVAIGLSFCGRAARSAEEVKAVPHRAVVHVCPEKLTAKDTLADGPSGKRIEIGGETTLIWVGLAPDARYAHDTEYVLITARGTQVVKGQWWPVVNGREVLRGEAKGRVEVPIEVNGDVVR